MENEEKVREYLLLLEYITGYILLGLAFNLFISDLVYKDPRFLISSIITFGLTLFIFIFHIIKTHEFEFTKFVVHVLLFSAAGTSYYYLLMFYIANYVYDGIPGILPVLIGAIVLPVVVIGSLFISEKDKNGIILFIWLMSALLFLVWFYPMFYT